MAKLNQRSALVLILVFSLGFAGAAQSVSWVSFQGGMKEEPNVKVLSSNEFSTLLQIEINGMFVEEIEEKGIIYHRLRLSNLASTQEIGSPELPVIGELVQIPDRSNVKITVVESETILLDGYRVYPFQQPVTDKDPLPGFFINEDVYSNNSIYPAEQAVLGDIGIMRDIRIVPARITPIRFNPVEEQLEVATRLIVELEYYGTSDQAVRTTPRRPISPRWSDMYKSLVINYDEFGEELDEGTDEFQVKYLFICTDEGPAAIINELAQFRNAQGYGVEVKLMEPAFDSDTEFRDYIHDLYVSDGLEYVMLVGDYCTVTGNTEMPMHYWVDSWSDSWYSMIDPWPNNGNDYYADISIGRMVYDDLTELQHQVDKTMGYLLNPSTEDNWAENCLLVAHEEEYPLKYTLCSEEIRTYAYSLQTPIFEQGYGGAGYTNDDVIDYLNSTGNGILNYRGHGSQTAWWHWGDTGDFNATHINQLTNEDKLFVHFDVCCDNMDFPGTNGNCFAESFMKADYGCVAIHSAIIPSYTIPNHDYDKEFFKAIFDEGIRNIGYASNFANVTVYNDHGWLGESNIRTYLWLGDSSIDPWTYTPQDLVVTHLPVVNIGATSLEVSVSMGDPVEGAMVCTQNAEVYSVGYTDVTGSVVIDLGNPLVQPGDLGLTVTCTNGLPYQVNIPVIPAAGPYVVADVCTVVDAAGWYPNGEMNYDETVALTLTMDNVGIEDAENVDVTISCADELMTIIDDTENYGTIVVDGSVTIDEGFAVMCDGSVDDGHVFLYTVSATDGVITWESYFAIQAYAPDVEFDQVTFTDIGGNNNNWLDPGETASMTVHVINNGGAGGFDISGLVSTTDPYITVTLAEADYGAILSGAPGEATFNVSADINTPQEHPATLHLDLSGLHGYTGGFDFEVLVGNILYDPTGPDNYGYVAYDPFDAPELPQFDWVEICADSGGPGTLIDFAVDDSCANLDLPFTFQYYGIDYDQFTIGTNGWIGMGTITTEDYSNSSIPNVDGPAPMIAPYWEDLSPQRPNSGGVWIWDDFDNHRCIIEYNHVEQYAPLDAFETFQVILYDPVYYPTTTGDGRILFQYKDMSAIATGVEGTVGIENSTETDGIQYLLDGTYETHGHSIQNGFAILFTTSQIMSNLTLDAEPLVDPIIIPSNGGNFSFDVDVVNNSNQVEIFDAWIELELPNGNPYEVMVVNNVTLGANSTLSRTMTQAVPGFAPSGIYAYKCIIGDHPNNIEAMDQFPFTKTGIGVASENDSWEVYGWDEEKDFAVLTPTSYFLEQNSPNPFNPITNISFGLPESGIVSLRVFNIMGREVAVLQDGRVEAGVHNVKFDASHLASGIYFYRLDTASFRAIKKMVLVK